MEKLQDLEKRKTQIRCPRCDRVLMQAAVVINGVIKCEHCHRKYAINVNDGGLSIILISQPKDEQ